MESNVKPEVANAVRRGPVCGMAEYVWDAVIDGPSQVESIRPMRPASPDSAIPLGAWVDYNSAFQAESEFTDAGGTSTFGVITGYGAYTYIFQQDAATWENYRAQNPETVQGNASTSWVVADATFLPQFVVRNEPMLTGSVRLFVPWYLPASIRNS